MKSAKEFISYLDFIDDSELEKNGELSVAGYDIVLYTYRKNHWFFGDTYYCYATYRYGMLNLVGEGDHYAKITSVLSAIKSLAYSMERAGVFKAPSEPINPNLSIPSRKS